MNLSNYFALMLVFHSSLLSGASSRFRILNGDLSKIEDSPYMVSLHYFGKYVCAGSMVNLETVITVAHCVTNIEAPYIEVKVGVTNMNAAGQVRNVQCLIIPPTYDEEIAHMDIAAIKVNPPFIESSAIKPIALCNTKLKPYTEMRISGWGAIRKASKEPTELLRTAFVDIISKQYCARSFKHIQALTSSMICAGLGKGGSDRCFGDSGAPGVVNGQICAVVSAGKGCGDPNYPGIYTNLNNVQVLKFVKESMKPTPVEKEQRSSVKKLFACFKKKNKSVIRHIV
ncbi:hypodermin-A-like [Eurosta solidaginis]|uniref:hypodermin-A-like n=1 Tax=Eurosta solidaginis TaxID=178769 RepID=UPI003530AC34